MFKFLIGVLVGAAGYWIWQSFGRDLLGMGDDNAFGPSSSTYGGSSTPAWSAEPGSAVAPPPKLAAESNGKPAAEKPEAKPSGTVKKTASTEAAAS